jgi:hypothetical protein
MEVINSVGEEYVDYFLTVPSSQFYLLVLIVLKMVSDGTI